MTRILMLVAAGIMAMVLSACGEGSKKPEEMKSDATVQQTQDNSQQDNGQQDKAAQSGDQQAPQDDQASAPQEDGQPAPASNEPAAQ